MKKFSIVQIILLIIFIGSLFFSTMSSPSVSRVEVVGGTLTMADVSDQQVRITFSRPMNKKSVEDAFNVDPKIEGNISWSQQTLFFYPN